MNRSQLEHIIRASSAITLEREFVVVGSQSVLGAHPDAPAALLRSMDLDLYPRDRPEASALIDGAIGEGSAFHQTFGYYAHGDKPMAHTWSWKLLRAGRIRLDGGGMFGVVPRVIWERMSPPDAQNRIGLQCNCLLLEDGSRRILIETGFGEKWSDKERGFWDLERRTVYDALREAGTAPEAIDLVIVTHLHFDHAAALTRPGPGGEPRPAFPAAPIVVQKREWEDACANRSTMTRTYLQSTTAPIAGKLRLVEGEREVAPGIVVWPVPGHTWGMQAVRFDDGRGTVCFPGDVMPTVNHAAPAFSMGYDMMPWENMSTKRALLDRAAAEGWRLVLDHEPGPPVMRVEADPERAGRHKLVPQAIPGAGVPA